MFTRSNTSILSGCFKGNSNFDFCLYLKIGYPPKVLQFRSHCCVSLENDLLVLSYAIHIIIAVWHRYIAFLSECLYFINKLHFCSQWIYTCFFLWHSQSHLKMLAELLHKSLIIRRFTIIFINVIILFHNIIRLSGFDISRGLSSMTYSSKRDFNKIFNISKSYHGSSLYNQKLTRSLVF